MEDCGDRGSKEITKAQTMKIPTTVPVQKRTKRNQAKERLKSRPVSESVKTGQKRPTSILRRSTMMSTKKIVLLGKTGAGKSSLANTILQQEHFVINHTFNSETQECDETSGNINGRSITLIDTPGLFDTGMSEEKLRSEILRCMTKCASGVDCFLILLKMEKFTEQEQEVVQKILEYFSDEVLKYCVVVFTHGDQLPDGAEVKELVSENGFVSDLLGKCSERCHVFDNKYWKDKPKEEYRSNQFQVESLLQTIDEMVTANRSCYTNEMLREVEEEIKQEEVKIQRQSGILSEKEIRLRAEHNVFKKLLIRLAGVETGALLGALFGVKMVGEARIFAKESEKMEKLNKAVQGHKIEETGAPAALLLSAAAAGAVRGGLVGWKSAAGAATKAEASQRARENVEKKALDVLDQINKRKNKFKS